MDYRRYFFREKLIFHTLSTLINSEEMMEKYLYILYVFFIYYIYFFKSLEREREREYNLR